MLFWRQRVDPLKSMMKALIASKTAINKLNAIESRIESRRKYLVETAIKLEEMGNTFLSKKYIEEAQRLEGILNRISYIKLILEKISLTLELNIEMRKFSKDLIGVLEVVTLLKKLPETTIPEIGIAIHEIESNVKDIINTSINIDVDIEPTYNPSDESSKILEEAKILVKQKLLGELHLSK